jgi:hypothetical protein
MSVLTTILPEKEDDGANDSSMASQETLIHIFVHMD